MYLTPIDYSRIGSVLAWPAGIADVAMTGFSLGIAWAVDRRVRLSRAARDGARARPHIGVGFPLLALLLLYISTWTYRHAFAQPPFVLSIAIPLMAALAAIRALVYGMRRVFARQEWLVPWEHMLGGAVWVLLLLYYVGVLPDILQTLDDIQVPIGKTHPTLLSIVTGIVVLIGSLIVTLWISATIERRLDRTTTIDSNLRAILSRLIRAVLLVAGGLIALEAVGFDLTILTIFGGAVGVGIGLGLQRLAANYISGFTILLDRSVRLGDTIMVEGKWKGTVTRVTARYVVVRSDEGVDVIVPNETLVTTTVLNYSHAPTAAPQVRIPIQVPVPPDTDIDAAMRLLEQAALADPHVLRDKPFAPCALVASFAEAGVTLELGVFVADAAVDPLTLKGVIQREILRLFAARGITIAFPRREVHVTGLPAAQMQGDGRAAAPSGAAGQ